MSDLLAISFDINIGSLISIPIILVVGGVIWAWLKKQLVPIAAEVGKIAATVEESVEKRFVAITDSSAENQKVVLVKLEAIEKQVTATNGRVTANEAKDVAQDIAIAALQAEVLLHKLALERMQGREDERRAAAANPAQTAAATPTSPLAIPPTATQQ